MDEGGAIAAEELLTILAGDRDRLAKAMSARLMKPVVRAMIEADNSSDITDRALAGSDTLATSRALSLALQREKPDLIICGRNSADGDTGQVGPEIAELMGLPHISSARKLDLSDDGKSVVAERITDEGMISFTIVLAVGFWKHGFHFFSLFVPHGTPWPMIPIIAPIELISFMVRPFSLALRLFVAMMAGHVLLEVLSSFVISGGNAGPLYGVAIGIPSMVLMIAICALELLVAGIQAYVFALLTSLYINDAENLH